MGQVVNQLVNIIANAGVVGGCQKVCSMLNNTAEAEVCTVLCMAVGKELVIRRRQLHSQDLAGVEEFAKILEEVDPSAINICALPFPRIGSP